MQASDARDDMLALTYDRSPDPWETSAGLRLQRAPRPRLDLRRDCRDDSMVLVRPLLTGSCASDRGVRHRRGLGDQILYSIYEQGSDVHGAVWSTILDRGRECIVPVSEFEPARFEHLIDTHPKVMIRWD